MEQAKGYCKIKIHRSAKNNPKVKNKIPCQILHFSLNLKYLHLEDTMTCFRA